MNGFDKIAFIYDWLAKLVFGDSIKKAQKYFLNQIPDCSKILILGGGSGWILTELFAARANVEVCYIDASAKMISLAKEKINNKQRVQFIHGTEDSIPERDQFDFLITSFYLDLFSDKLLLEALLKIKESLNPNGQWIATDFVNTRWWQRQMLKIMYLFFRVTCNINSKKLPEWNNALLGAGGVKKGSKLYYKGFIETTLFQF